MESSIIQAFNLAFAKLLVNEKIIDKGLLRQYYIKERASKIVTFGVLKEVEKEIVSFLGVEDKHVS